VVALAEQSGRCEHSTNAFRQSAENTDTVAMTLAHIKGGMKLVRNECPRITTCKVVNQMAAGQHLKQGRAYPDPIATAKATGTHFSGTTKHNVITPTPDGGKNSSPDSKGWAPINPAAAPNTYTGKGGSKR
jgi:hypothetical protein